MSGYILAPRDVLATVPLEKVGPWLDIVQRATWKDYTMRNGLTLKRGEVLIAYSRLADEWGWTRRKVEMIVQKFVKMGLLVRRDGWKTRDRRGTVYLVANYDAYTPAGWEARASTRATEEVSKSKTTPPSPTPPPEEFGMFRAAYPANGRTNWKQAESRYAKVVATVGAGVLLAKATEYAGSRDARDPQYVMGAQVWLHTKRGWEIEYETTNGSTSTGAKLSEAGQFYD